MYKKATILLIIATAFSGSALCATGPRVTHAYGADASQVLDSYSPPGSGHPILVYTHGGSWHVGSKDNNVENKKNGLVGARDYVLVSVEYRSGFQTNWQGQANDIASAIKWVYNNAAAIGGSNANIFLVGHSSGAHMTALVATDDDFGVRALIRGTVLLDSGDYDVVDGYNNCSTDGCNKYGAFWDNYNLLSMGDGSPVNHADDNLAAPTLLIHRNTPFKLNQANLMNSALHAGGQSQVEQYGTNDGHEAINDNIGAAGYPYTAQVSGFLGALVITPPPGC